MPKRRDTGRWEVKKNAGCLYQLQADHVYNDEPEQNAVTQDALWRKMTNDRISQ